MLVDVLNRTQSRHSWPEYSLVCFPSWRDCWPKCCHPGSFSIAQWWPSYTIGMVPIYVKPNGGQGEEWNNPHMAVGVFLDLWTLVGRGGRQRITVILVPWGTLLIFAFSCFTVVYTILLLLLICRKFSWHLICLDKKCCHLFRSILPPAFMWSIKVWKTKNAWCGDVCNCLWMCSHLLPYTPTAAIHTNSCHSY